MNNSKKKDLNYLIRDCELACPKAGDLDKVNAVVLSWSLHQEATGLAVNIHYLNEVQTLPGRAPFLKSARGRCIK